VYGAAYEYGGYGFGHGERRYDGGCVVSFKVLLVAYGVVLYDKEGYGVVVFEVFVEGNVGVVIGDDCFGVFACFRTVVECYGCGVGVLYGVGGEFFIVFDVGKVVENVAADLTRGKCEDD